MLTQPEIDDFIKIIQKVDPTFGKPVPTKDQWAPLNRNTQYGYIPVSLLKYPPRLTSFTACCALRALVANTPASPVSICSDVAEMTGITYLANYSDADIAALALVLNCPLSSMITAYCATSAANIPNGWAAEEKVLIRCGFKPYYRAKNIQHGPNTLTLWLLDIAKSEPFPPGPTPLTALPTEFPAPAVIVKKKKRLIGAKIGRLRR